jgi:hypothetical protein
MFVRSAGDCSEMKVLTANLTSTDVSRRNKLRNCILNDSRITLSLDDLRRIE